MKKLTTIIVLILYFVSVKAQDYYFFGERITLTEINNQILISLDDNTTLEERELILQSIKSAYDISETVFSPILLDRNPWKRSHIIFTCNASDVDEIINSVLEYPNVIYADNLYNSGQDSKEIGVTNEIVVLLSESTSKDFFMRAVTDIGCELRMENGVIPNQFIITCSKNDDVFLKAEELYNYSICEYSYPNFVRLNGHMTNDPLFGNQWPLLNTGQNGGTFGADIEFLNVFQNITGGSGFIKIAIVDDGVDLNHEDLIGNLLQGHDASGNNNNGDWYGDHGTACAGIAAARGNNGKGISGVAPYCRIIPVSTSALTETQLSSAIRWAAETGDADIISNSWGGTYSQAIVREIDWATNNGRNGLGCVVVFASGNDGASSVSFPSSLPNVISVGATDKDDFKTSYSNYGSQLDVVAPGGNQDIYTTDIEAPGAGYDGASAYYNSFEGTSAAAPHVAGVAGLVLSVNPCLTYTDVQRVIELSCDKPAAYAFCGNNTSGTWNEKMGYGRVNATKAVRLALDFEHLSHVSNNSSSLTTTFSTWGLTNSCSNPAAGTYLNVEQHKVETIVAVPYSPSGNYRVATNGISASNPNSSYNYATITNINSSQIKAETYVYFIKQNSLGQTINLWYPTQPSNVWFKFSNYNVGELHFQNRNENNLSNTYKNIKPIHAGNNVTSAVSQGDYHLQSGNEIKFISKEYVSLQPGFIASYGNTFEAGIGKFNKCSQYPNGLYKKGNKDTTKQDYTFYNTNKHPIVQSDILSKSTVYIYPNPTTGAFNIEVPQVGNYTIRVMNMLGSTVYEGKMADEQKKSMQLDNNLPPGNYTLHISGDSLRHVERITLTK